MTEPELYVMLTVRDLEAEIADQEWRAAVSPIEYQDRFRGEGSRLALGLEQIAEALRMLRDRGGR